MSVDVQFFCACDHIVDNKQYIGTDCPRCYGKGYYLDIFFDINGSPRLASGSIKLQQEVLKIILDDKYTNPFHPEWGSEVSKNSIGVKNLAISKIKLELAIRNAMEYLRNTQIAENSKWNNMTDEEILNNIEYVEVTPLGKTGFSVDVVFSNNVTQLYNQVITL